ncbi:Prominin-1 [Lamellibrachia satsuma]|nr:Prominin-1 [Lamellibrachia satsuma]
MASVGFTIIFFAFLMIFLILFFIIGAPLQKLLCKPLMDPEFKAFDVLLDGKNGLLHKDGYFLGNMLLQNSSIPLTFKNVLNDCRDNKPSYSALKLESKFDLEEMTDYSDKIDINSTMSKINVDLSSVVLLSDTTETLLRNFSQAVQLDYQGFRDELEKNTTKAGKDLTDFIRRVREAANDGSTSLTAKTKLNAEADKLSTLNGGLLRDTTQNQEALLVDVNTLNATTKNVPTDVDNMIASTKASEKYIHDEGSDMVKQVTQVLVKRILATADQFASHVVHSVKNDLMGCKPLWNLWESIVHGAVCGHGVQTMNGFWFALGWSVFFMFFGMIFSVKTAKYFRKMKNGKVGHHDGDPTVGQTKMEVYLPSNAKYPAAGAYENEVSPGGDFSALALGDQVQSEPHGDQADPQGDQAEPQGDQADPQGDQADPQGDQADTQGDQADPQGEQADPHGEQADPQGDQADPQGDQADPQGNQADPQGEQADPQGEQADPQGEQADPKVNSLYR